MSYRNGLGGLITSATVLFVLLPLLSACRTHESAGLKDSVGSANAPARAAKVTPKDEQPPAWALELGESKFIDPENPKHDEDYWIGELVKFFTQSVNDSKDGDGAHRAVHAKPHGCVTATFKIRSDRPEESKYGVFEKEGTYKTWIRFSNAAAVVKSDTSTDVRGMAIKLINVVGPKLLPGQVSSNTLDFPFVSGPIFPVRDVKEYFELQTNRDAFLKAHPRTVALSITDAAHTMKSPLLGTFWSMGAYKLGPNAVKFSARPCKEPLFNWPLTFNPKYLRDAMIKQLTTERKPACFDFGVQFRKNPPTMPVEDPSVEWREEESFFSSLKRPFGGEDPISKFIPIATIDIPAQEFSSPAQEDFCERLSINPWRTLAVQRPLGNLMRSRLKAYAASAKERTRVNGKPIIDDKTLTGEQSDVKKNSSL